MRKLLFVSSYRAFVKRTFPIWTIAFLTSAGYLALQHVTKTTYNANQKVFIRQSTDEDERFGVEFRRNFTILVWTHGERMQRRFLKSYGKLPNDPYKWCSVRNCNLVIDNAKLADADAVMFHLHQTKSPQTLPKTHLPGQIWIFFTDESPYHTFQVSRKYRISDYNGIFNWSMTYRSDSDVPVPYGRTVVMSIERSSDATAPNYATSKKKTVAILGSNCGGRNHRWDYVRELQKHISVDVYGRCGKLKCPGHFTKDCSPLRDYKFYLAFENSNCREYLTEKLWWNAYAKDALPVVMGARKEDYRRLCPPRSFVHVDDFESPESLATYLKHLDNNDTAYNEYFEWKRRYRVLNEHGYFGSPSLHLCRICEKLNSGETSTKPYNDLEAFWSKRTDCFDASWKSKR